jgi:hypothetical protein
MGYSQLSAILIIASQPRKKHCYEIDIYDITIKESNSL